MQAAHEPSAFDQRWQQIRTVWRKSLLEYRLLFIVALIVAGLWIFGRNGFGLGGDMLGYITNVATEALSIIVTVLILDRINERRASERATAALKDDLVRRAGSIANTFAVDAVEELRKRGWLTGDDGLLTGVSLRGANLTGARLAAANLEGADLTEAELEDANLQGAILKRANLWDAKLTGADLSKAELAGANLFTAQLEGATLRGAQLEGAILIGAQLEGATLRGAQLESATLIGAQLEGATLRGAQLAGATLSVAKLEGADLREAELAGADLSGANLADAQNIETAVFDPKTVLPDAERVLNEQGDPMTDDAGRPVYTATSYWTSETDMTRYTNREHPNFWQPQWAILNFESRVAWIFSGEPQPWREAGYGADHMAWLRDGKPERKPDDAQ